MKKTIVIITSVFAFLFLIGCNKLSTRGEELLENTASYTKIAEYAYTNFRTDEYSVSSNRYSVRLRDIADIDAISSDVSVAIQDYTYFWIEDSCVVFWNDETMKEGILCAFDSEEALKDIKTWYEDVQIEELTDSCYLLTQPRAWIG